jgi:hypothetical protein
VEGELNELFSHDAVPEEVDQQHQSGLNEPAEDRPSSDENGDDDETGNDIADDAPEDAWSKVTGPLSKEGKREAQKLGLMVSTEAERIARKYHKGRRQILLAAGLGVRPARAKNPYNMFIKWYAHHHPRNDREFTVPPHCMRLTSLSSQFRGIWKAYE